MSEPLAGKYLLVTRPAAQAGSLATAIRTAGGIPVLQPLIDIEPVADPERFAALAAGLDCFAIAFFVSANAVEHGLAAIRAHRAWPPGPRVATVGPGSARALLEAGFADVIAPLGRFDSEAVLDLPEFSADAVRDREVLIVKGEGGRELLAEALESRGARVTRLECYRRVLAPPDTAGLNRQLAEGKLDGITLSSSEAARHLGAALSGEAFAALRALPVFAPHARVAEAARAAGFSRVLLTDGADEGILAGLEAYYAKVPEGLGYHHAMENARPPAPVVSPRRSLRALSANPFVVVALIALVLLAWQWLETRTRLDLLQQQLAQRLGESDAATREVRSQSRDVQERIQTQGNRLAVVEARLSEAQGQQAALEALYQDLSRSRDEWVLAEVEQALNIAQQQLQLAGNVQAALIALQSAEARLAGFERPQLLPLRKSIGRDIERLKALPMADTSSLGLALENLIDRIDTLPLAFEHSPPKPEKARGARSAKPKAGSSQPSETPAETPGLFTALVSDFWNELRQVIRVERLDRPDPALLSPAQAVFLRENLRLRLLSARLALLQRDGRVFREDTRQATIWMERYFDTADRDVAQRVSDLKKMQTIRLSLELPNLNDTLAALRNVRLAGSR